MPRALRGLGAPTGTAASNTLAVCRFEHLAVLPRHCRPAAPARLRAPPDSGSWSGLLVLKHAGFTAYRYAPLCGYLPPRGRVRRRVRASVPMTFKFETRARARSCADAVELSRNPYVKSGTKRPKWNGMPRSRSDGIKDRSIDIKAFINRVYVNSTRVCIITPKSKSSDIDRLPT